MEKLQLIINDLKDAGVSGEYDQNPVTREELAEILEIIVAELGKE